MALTATFVARVVSGAEEAAARQASRRRVAQLRGRKVEEEEDLGRVCALVARVAATRQEALRDDHAWPAYFEAAQALVEVQDRSVDRCREEKHTMDCSCGVGLAASFAPPAEKQRRKGHREDVRRLGAAARREAVLGWSRARPSEAAEILAKGLCDVEEEEADAELWAKRAAVFQRALDASSPLGARILVEMHLEKAALVDATDEDHADAFREAQTRNDALALSADDHDAKTMTGDASVYTEALALCGHGEAYMREQFYLSAATKFQGALAALRTFDDDDADDGERLLLRSARVACHLNIAACYALRGLGPADDAIVEEHTSACLAIDDRSVPALLRRAEALQRRGAFDAARTDLRRAIDILSSSSRDDGDEEGRQQRVARAEARLHHVDFLERAQTY